MGLPSVIINFKETGITAIKRGERGIVALILKDDSVEALESHVLLTVNEAPERLSADNKEQIELAFMGYQTPPKKVIIVVIPESAENYNDATKYLETIRWDYLAIPTIQAGDVTTIATWVKSLNDTMDKKCKVVLPNSKSDHECVVNFTSDNIVTATKTYTTAEYCSRLAGIL